MRSESAAEMYVNRTFRLVHFSSSFNFVNLHFINKKRKINVTNINSQIWYICGFSFSCDIVYMNSFVFCYRPQKKKAKLNANESAKKGKMDVPPKKLVLFHNCPVFQ